MDILEAIKSVTEADIAKAVDKLDKELAEIQYNIVQYCADGNIERACECLAQYDESMKLKAIVCGIKTENVMEV